MSCKRNRRAKQFWPACRNLSVPYLKCLSCKWAFGLSENHSTGLKDALYDIVFLHPEACLSSKEGLLLLQSKPYQTSVEAIVVDEAHCILEW